MICGESFHINFQRQAIKIIKLVKAHMSLLVNNISSHKNHFIHFISYLLCNENYNLQENSNLIPLGSDFSLD